MRRWLLIALLLGLFTWTASLSAKDNSPLFKFAEVKHFTLGDKVELSQDFVTSFDDHLRADLLKDNVTAQVVDEGGTWPQEDDASSIVVVGKFTKFKEAGHTKGSPGKLEWEINVYRKSDNLLLANVISGDNVAAGSKEDELAVTMAARVSSLLKKALK